MKSKSKTSRVIDRYGMIEALEPRIAPAAVLTGLLPLPASPKFVTATVGGSLLVKAGEVLTTGSNGGGAYLLYVAQGQVLVHTTDLANDNRVDFADITGISAGAGAQFVSFVDIHGPVVTDLKTDGTLSDGGKGDILLDNNIATIDLRSLTTTDFVGTASQSPTALVNAHLAMSSYSIFGNIYAGGGLGLANNPTSGLIIDNSGTTLQATKYPGGAGTDFYQPTVPVIGSIYAGSSASGQSFSFGASGAKTDVHGNLLAFNPAPGEAGASIYNISAATTSTAFSIGTIHAGDGGFNAPGGSIVNVALDGQTMGTTQLIAGNAGSGTTGQTGGSIINFSDTGAIQSEVLLQSGNGGPGLTGPGGNAGVINFNPVGTVQANAHFVLNYGSGGDGYTKGGAGGGTPANTFLTPEGKLTQGINLVSTMHVPGSVGSTTPFDFTPIGYYESIYSNNAAVAGLISHSSDGYSDAVFSTTNPDQVVVAFGGQLTSTSAPYLGIGQAGDFYLNYTHFIYLNSPTQVDSIVVGDFTGAKNPVTHQPELDIAVACGTGSFAGVEVFLSKYNPKTGAFEGFSDPLFSPLPSLAQDGYYYTSTPITKLLAGDFSGTGNTQLAVVVNETTFNMAVDPVLMFLTPETDTLHPGGTGYFYANFNNGFPFQDISGNFGTAYNASTFVVTAPKAFAPGNGNDIIIGAAVGSNYFYTFSYQFGGVGSFGYTFGQVHIPGAPSPTDFHVQSFTVTQDLRNPSIADIVAVSATPQGFFVTLRGDGQGGFAISSPAAVGIIFGYGSTIKPVAIVTLPNSTGANPTPSLVYSDVAILDYDTTKADAILVYNITENAQHVTNATLTAVLDTLSPNNRNATSVAFDAYYPYPAASASVAGSGPGEFGFITANPFQDYEGHGSESLTVSQPIPYATSPNGLNNGFGFNFTLAPFKDAGYYFTAGNGGNSESGPAGAGSSFGQSLTLTGSGETTSGTGTLSVVFPADVTYEGTARFLAGNGGDGFTAGGAGGTLNGISVTYNNASVLSGTAQLVAGNGGESLIGVGGAGGSLSQLFIVSGEFFVAGNGGIGVVGGSGGSLLGNTQPGALTAEANNYNDTLILKGGDGATGIIGGGSGGSINSFVNWFPPILGQEGGRLNYTAGNAGDAVAGQGGTGGSIINCSPFTLDNNLVGDIFLQGGQGGSGNFGGAGGSVTNFSQVSTVADIPTSSTFYAGMGGASTTGVGGAGGSISGINVSASGFGGTLFTYDFSAADLVNNGVPAGTPTALSYNRMVAGAGGLSFGGVGGAGGSVSNIDTASVASNSQNVVAAGAGGEGLTGGGAGGNIFFANVDAGSNAGEGKVVVIAGDGGAAFSARPLDPTNPKEVDLAIGGVSGPGGNGGSITSFTQNVNVNTHVDLIAGNGGATINHSVVAGNAPVNPKTGVQYDNSGVGGSMTNIAVTGSIGNCDTTTAIKSYNDIFAGQSMQDFVDSYILGNPSLPMDDSIGNVGLVAGAAGRVEGGLPSTNGVSGSVSNVFAANIMSMVAGNVDQVDLIHSLTNYGVTISGGILGANKIAYYNPATQTVEDIGVLGKLNYISVDGGLVNTPLPGGGELIDGAFIAKNIRTPLSARDFVGTQG